MLWAGSIKAQRAIIFSQLVEFETWLKMAKFLERLEKEYPRWIG
jgi:hypothetical protein